MGCSAGNKTLEFALPKQTPLSAAAFQQQSEGTSRSKREKGSNWIADTQANGMPRDEAAAQQSHNQRDEDRRTYENCYQNVQYSTWQPLVPARPQFRSHAYLTNLRPVASFTPRPDLYGHRYQGGKPSTPASPLFPAVDPAGQTAQHFAAIQSQQQWTKPTLHPHDPQPTEEDVPFLNGLGTLATALFPKTEAVGQMAQDFAATQPQQQKTTTPESQPTLQRPERQPTAENIPNSLRTPISIPADLNPQPATGAQVRSSHRLLTRPSPIATPNCCTSSRQLNPSANCAVPR
jgi:hypothetical protein